MQKKLLVNLGYKDTGIDVGLIKLIATTDNEPADPPKYLRKSEKKLKKAVESVAIKRQQRRELQIPPVLPVC